MRIRARGSETLARLCFSRSEMELALPVPSSPTPHFSSSAKAYTIAFKPAPRSLSSIIASTSSAQGVKRLWVFESLYLPLDRMMIGAFPLESGCSSTPSNVDHQVAMDMCSIQHQRRTMGLRDRCIYCAKYVGGIFTLLASWWVESTLVSLSFL